MRNYIFLFILFFFYGISQTFALGEFSFESYKSANQNLTTGSSTVFIGNVETYDTDNQHNITTGVFTPNKAGMYSCHFRLNYQTALTNTSTGSYIQVVFRKNGLIASVSRNYIKNTPNTYLDSFYSSNRFLLSSSDILDVYISYVGATANSVLSITGGFGESAFSCFGQSLQTVYSLTGVTMYQSGITVPVTNNISLSGSNSSGTGSSITPVYYTGAGDYMPLYYLSDDGQYYFNKSSFFTFLIWFWLIALFGFSFIALSIKFFKLGIK